jgi:hypothetical protein
MSKIMFIFAAKLESEFVEGNSQVQILNRSRLEGCILYSRWGS